MTEDKYGDIVDDLSEPFNINGSPKLNNTIRYLVDKMKVVDPDSINAKLAETANELRDTQSNPTNHVGAIVTFIDDDADPSFNTIWKPILEETGVKIGLAVVTGRVGKSNSLTLDELKNLQMQGHDIYSHTVNHYATYDTSVTPEILDVEYQNSQKWMKDNGFNCYDILVYPGGLDGKNTSKKSVARKYFKYAVTIGYKDGIEHSPIDNWAVNRLNADTATETTLKSYIDEAIKSGGWLILMNHSYELNKDLDNQKNKLRNVINYCKSVGVPIMPFSQAIKYKGNVVAIGEHTKTDSFFVGADGNNSLFNIANSNVDMDRHIDLYRSRHTRVPLTYLQDTFSAQGGVMDVFKAENSAYSYALFTPLNKNRIFMRKWNGSSWGQWQLTSGTEFNTLKPTETMDDGLVTFTKNAITLTKIEYTKDNLTNAGGVRITYRLEDDSYSYQTFTPYNKNKIYTRKWTGSSWGAWKLIGGTDINSVNNGSILANDISTFPSDAISIYPCQTNASNPEGKGGIYKVYNFTDTSYAYSEFKIYNSNSEYRRRWTGSAWTAWEKVSAV